METKICKKCSCEQELCCFPKDSTKKDGLHPHCKKCRILYRQTMKSHIKNKNKLYYLENKEKQLNISKKYREINKDSIREYQKSYRDKNKKKINKQRKVYKLLNKEVFNEKRRIYENNKLANDYTFKLKHNLKTLIRNSFRYKSYKKNSKTEEILGCSYEQFKLYLESKFESWMNWDNRGLYNGQPNYGWDIDHIIPLSSATCEADIVRLNHYTNLQPLCSKINRDIKKDKN